MKTRVLKLGNSEVFKIEYKTFLFWKELRGRVTYFNSEATIHENPDKGVILFTEMYQVESAIKFLQERERKKAIPNWEIV